MKRESKHLATMLVGGALLVLGVAILLGAFEVTAVSETALHYIVSGLIGGGALLVAFGDPRAAVDGIARLLPWGKPRSSTQISKFGSSDENERPSARPGPGE